MPTCIVKTEAAYKVEIFMGGDVHEAKRVCLEYCSDVGLCVTVEPTTYVYKGGMCDGIRVGLINYARFPKTQEAIWSLAADLADTLKYRLAQGSYTIQDHEISLFYSTRPEDGCDG